ncbi:MAG: efflux RND transporter periplasmic adaptor subunit [Verrucomicrobia bacterium]|nr:efflux RND transporter periplasmic adaptor subunit [Verrucomicrobiota bacterium]
MQGAGALSSSRLRKRFPLEAWGNLDQILGHECKIDEVRQLMDRHRLQRTACHILRIAMLMMLAACSKPAKPIAGADVDYWTCTMHPSVHSETPGKCPICGMDLVPVTRRKEVSSKPGEFMVPIQRQQQIGVTYTEVRRRHMQFDIRSVGTLEADQAQVFDCVARVDGYVEGLQVTSPGERVRSGQPLMTIYSPDLRAPEQELANLLKVQVNGSVTPASMEPLIEAARRRLLLLNVDPSEISELERTGQLTDRLVVRSAVDGVVSEVPIRIGMGVKPGDKLVTVLDVSNLWLWANFYENEVGLLREGHPVTVSLPALPDHPFEGKIAVLSPSIDPVKRTAMARINIPNSDGQLRPGMFANVIAHIDAGKGLTIPSDAVLPTGLRMVAFVDRGSGRLQPRFIQVGRQFVDLTDPNQESYYEVTDGLREGERVVSSANFLIDAEAQVQGALRDFGVEQR